MSRGRFITIEGTEGAGKSTALAFICDFLQTAGHDIVRTREPGGTEIAEEIRKVLLHTATNERMRSETELLLMFAGRAQHVAACIEPALAAGKWVVSDRYIDASYAYQGAGRGIDTQYIATLDKMVVGDHYPDLTLLLDLPAELGFARAVKRNAQRDRIEQEKIDFFVRVRNAYLARAKADPERIKVIDASLDLAQVQAQLASCLQDFLLKVAA
jgi:dTMP kinase